MLTKGSSSDVPPKSEQSALPNFAIVQRIGASALPKKIEQQSALPLRLLPSRQLDSDQIDHILLDDIDVEQV